MHRIHLSLALLVAACGVTQEDLDAAVAGLASTSELDAAVEGLATTSDLDAAVGDLASEDDVADAIDDHLAAADHGRTTDASELTSGTLAPERLPVIRRTVSVDVMSAFHDAAVVVGTGGFGNSGLRLPDAGTPGFRFAFVVPEDFIGTEVTARVGWRTEGTNCTMDLRPNSIDRARDGYLPASGSATAGFTGPVTAMNAGVSPEVGHVAEYTITGAGYGDLEPGDGIVLAFYRSASDSCTDELLITSLSVVYDGY